MHALHISITTCALAATLLVQHMRSHFISPAHCPAPYLHTRVPIKLLLLLLRCMLHG